MKTPQLLSAQTLSLLLAQKKPFSQPVILCIGTDRIIGDCLGPLTGSILSRSLPSFPVYGTLQNTVHALNLAEILREIKETHPYPYIIAVDASLGSARQIHSIFVRSGPILPGSGVRKVLPSAGDISITGVVNEESVHPYLALQTSRLSSVAKMAEKIADCLEEVLTNVSFPIS